MTQGEAGSQQDEAGPGCMTVTQRACRQDPERRKRTRVHDTSVSRITTGRSWARVHDSNATSIPSGAQQSNEDTWASDDVEPVHNRTERGQGAVDSRKQQANRMLAVETGHGGRRKIGAG